MSVTGVTKTFSELAPKLTAAFRFRGECHLWKATEAFDNLTINILTQGLVSRTNRILNGFRGRRAVRNDGDAIGAQERGAADFRRIKRRAQARYRTAQQHEGHLTPPIGGEQTA